MTNNNNVKDMAVQMLLTAYARDEADKLLIITATENIYTMGIAQGMNNALEEMRKEWKGDECEGSTP